MSEQDDVSKIQKRYSLTLLNPSSHYISLVISIALAGIMTAFTTATYLQTNDIILPILCVIAALVGTFVPIILDKQGIDPAIATGPFITTANDIFGIFLFFYIAQFSLGF